MPRKTLAQIVKIALSKSNANQAYNTLQQDTALHYELLKSRLMSRKTEAEVSESQAKNLYRLLPEEHKNRIKKQFPEISFA